MEKKNDDRPRTFVFENRHGETKTTRECTEYEAALIIDEVDKIFGLLHGDESFDTASVAAGNIAAVFGDSSLFRFLMEIVTDYRMEYASRCALNGDTEKRMEGMMPRFTPKQQELLDLMVAHQRKKEKIYMIAFCAAVIVVCAFILVRAW